MNKKRKYEKVVTLSGEMRMMSQCEGKKMKIQRNLVTWRNYMQSMSECEERGGRMTHEGLKFAQNWLSLIELY